MPLVLGVDSSTSATLVEVRDADSGRLVASGTAPHPPVAPPRCEQDPTVWWSALLDAIAQTNQRDIAAMAVAGQQHGLVVTDSAGAVLRPAKLARDTEAAGHAAHLVEQFGAARWVDAVGIVPDASVTIAKLAWLRTREPATFRRVGHVLLPHDWLTFRLTGRMVTDRGDASGTGYWSPAENRWRPDLLHRLDAATSQDEWRNRLPTVLAPTAPADWLTASVHEIVGLRGRPIVAAGTGRQMAIALGIGLEVDEIAVSLGTDGGVFTTSNQPADDPTGAVRGFADATGRYLPFAPLDDAMDTIVGVARLLRLDAAGLGRLARRAPVGSGGLTVIPGSGARGAVIHELGSDAGPEHLARAAFEGVACAALERAEAVAKATGQTATGPLRVVGEAARSPTFRRILSDLGGTPVAASADLAPVAKGACVQAAAALAGCGPEHIAAAWGLHDSEVIEPNRSVDRAAVREAYAAAVGRTAQQR